MIGPEGVVTDYITILAAAATVSTAHQSAYMLFATPHNNVTSNQSKSRTIDNDSIAAHQGVLSKQHQLHILIDRFTA